jgi:hypothetical protein
MEEKGKLLKKKVSLEYQCIKAVDGMIISEFGMKAESYISYNDLLSYQKIHYHNSHQL